jgi:hypothetical protein
MITARAFIEQLSSEFDRGYRLGMVHGAEKFWELLSSVVDQRRSESPGDPLLTELLFEELGNTVDQMRKAL